MKYYLGLENVPCGLTRRVVTLGAFDGVHRGHRRLLEVASQAAQETGAEVSVLTFEPTPAEIFGRLGRPDIRLTLPEERRALLGSLGVETLVVARFDETLQEMLPEDFAREVLVACMNAAVVVASETHTFGRRASGDIATLSRLGCDLGFQVRVLPLLESNGYPVSSTRIRELLWTGRVEEANGLLGRMYSCRGEVVKGRGRGAALGFPTANLRVPPPKLVPAEGVYAGLVGLDEESDDLPAAIVVGPSPTFRDHDDVRYLEAHVLDFAGETLGREITVRFGQFLRAQERFARREDLVRQITADVAAVRDWVAGPQRAAEAGPSGALRGSRSR